MFGDRKTPMAWDHDQPDTPGWWFPVALMVLAVAGWIAFVWAVIR